MPGFKITVIFALAALASALALPSCTHTLLQDLTCCAPPAAHTTTSYVDCAGCWGFTPYPTMCDLVRCAKPTATDPARTTTVMACAASPTPTMETYVRRETGDSSRVDEICTVTAEKTTPGCGDCGQTTYATTKTLSHDCGGCALQTVDVEIPGICICATETSVMECMASPTIS